MNLKTESSNNNQSAQFLAFQPPRVIIVSCFERFEEDRRGDQQNHDGSSRCFSSLVPQWTRHLMVFYQLSLQFLSANFTFPISPLIFCGKDNLNLKYF